MFFYCIKYLMLTIKKINIQIKREITGKINLYSDCIDCGFKTFASIDEVELIYLLRGLNFKQFHLIV